MKGSGEYVKGDENEILQIDTYNAQIVTIKAVQDLIQLNQKLEKQVKLLSEENSLKTNEIEELKEQIHSVYKIEEELKLLKEIFEARANN